MYTNKYNMKKLLIILLIGVLPIIAISQTSTDSRNWKHTGTNTFTKQVTVQTKVLTGAKIDSLDMLVTKNTGAVNINTITTIPTIYTAAGDTSNQAVPGKVGNIFIDTSASKIYVSKAATRNGWVILN